MPEPRRIPRRSASRSGTNPPKHRATSRVRPDGIDFRDRLYAPPVCAAPPGAIEPTYRPKSVPNQGETGACTGYALANYVHYLLAKAGRKKDGPVSPRMLYSMARRYDELPGWKADEGSTARGALRGWFRHGACALSKWGDDVDLGSMPRARTKPSEDWWADAVKRPLGAYYRVASHSLSDMHAAIAEVGAVYVTAACHSGWDGGYVASGVKGIWTIPYDPTEEADEGHAFLIVGYDADGFLLLNSWGDEWGTRGIARLTYDDWLNNAMDAWVAQLGVVTRDHAQVAGVTSLRFEKTTKGGTVTVARDAALRDHELAAFVIDAGNEGALNGQGRFRTTPDDVAYLLSFQLDHFRKVHGIGADAVVDVAIYAHGGLVDEDGAADSARAWVPHLYENKVFPIFVMWETGFAKTLRNIADDAFRGPGEGARAGGVRTWIDERIERLASRLGTSVWDEIKENGEKLTTSPDGALRMLFEEGGGRRPLDPATTRLHLVGHSAGSIVHRHLADFLIARHRTIATMTFLAPALRVDAFRTSILPHIGGSIERYLEVHLKDAAERKDNCGPYSKSLLYLVSRAFERGREVPIVGMEKHLPSELRRLAGGGSVELHASPNASVQAVRHGEVDDDEGARNLAIEWIRRGPLGAS